MKIKLSRENSLFSMGEKLLFFILLLSFMGVYGYSLHLMFFAFVFFCFIKRRFYVPTSAIPPALLSLSMILTSSFSLSPSTWMTQLIWPLAFLIGYGLIHTSFDRTEEIERSEKRLNWCVFVAAGGFFIHLMLNLYANWGAEDIYRNTIDYWSGQAFAATGQAGLACVPLGFCVASLFKNANMKVKLPIILALIAILYYNLTLGSRTIVLSLLILCVVTLIYLMSANKSNAGKRRTLRTFLVIAIAVAVIYSTDMFGLRTLVEDSVLANRISGENTVELQEDARWENKLAYIKLMPLYLSGGGHIYSIVGSHAHDVLLDTYDQAGLLAFVAVLALLWDGISKLVKVLKAEHIYFDTKIMLLCVYLAVLIMFVVEPILEGMPWLLMTFCFLHGAVTALISQNSNADAPQK